MLIDVKGDIDYPNDDTLWDSYGDPLTHPFTDAYDNVVIDYLRDDNKLTGLTISARTQLAFPKPEKENEFYQEIFDNLRHALEDVEKEQKLPLAITDISMYQKVELENLEKEMQKRVAASPSEGK